MSLRIYLSWSLLCLVMACDQADYSQSDGPVSVLAPPVDWDLEFDFDSSEQHILLPLTWKNRNLRFALDTASYWTMIDKRYENELGAFVKSYRANTLGGKQMIPVYRTPKALKLGGRPLRTNLGVMSLTRFHDKDRRAIDGLIGMTVLKKTALQIDFSAGKVRLKKDPQDGLFPGEEFPFYVIGGGVWGFDVQIMDEPSLPIVVDSGYTGVGILEAGLFDRLVAKYQLPTKKSGLNTPRGFRESQTCEIPKLQVGSLKRENLIFKRGVGSLVGKKFLNHYLVTMDFPNQKIYLATQP